MTDIAATFSGLLTLIEMGGGFTLPLMAASVLTGELVLEQLWFSFLSGRRLRKLQMNPTQIKFMRGMDMVSRMVTAMRFSLSATEEDQKRALDRVYSHFERRINWLNLIASVAPLLGLLGTVAGMIRIFSTVAASKPKNPLADLSGGISEALFATGGGLVIAIIAALSYHFLSNRLESQGEAMAEWYSQNRNKLN
jgi:biopolymer transport protein ExbB